MKNIYIIISLVTLCITTSCGGKTNDQNQKPTDQKIEKNETAKEERSNGVFEILKISKDSVQFKVVNETKFYTIAFISDNESFEANNFSNSVGTVKWANGAEFWPGSNMGMPRTFGNDAMTLPNGAILTVYSFGTPKDFNALKIKFVTEGTNEMYYDILKSSWDQ